MERSREDLARTLESLCDVFEGVEEDRLGVEVLLALAVPHRPQPKRPVEDREELKDVACRLAHRPGQRPRPGKARAVLRSEEDLRAGDALPTSDERRRLPARSLVEGDRPRICRAGDPHVEKPAEARVDAEANARQLDAPIRRHAGEDVVEDEDLGPLLSIAVLELLELTERREKGPHELLPEEALPRLWSLAEIRHLGLQQLQLEVSFEYAAL